MINVKKLLSAILLFTYVMSSQAMLPALRLAGAAMRAASTRPGALMLRSAVVGTTCSRPFTVINKCNTSKDVTLSYEDVTNPDIAVHNLCINDGKFAVNKLYEFSAPMPVNVHISVAFKVYAGPDVGDAKMAYRFPDVTHYDDIVITQKYGFPPKMELVRNGKLARIEEDEKFRADLDLILSLKSKVKKGWRNN